MGEGSETQPVGFYFPIGSQQQAPVIALIRAPDEAERGARSEEGCVPIQLFWYCLIFWYRSVTYFGIWEALDGDTLAENVENGSHFGSASQQ